MTADRSALPARCLHCQAEQRSPIVCEGCQSLYPPPHSADYFDLLSVPRRYTVDEATLTAAFRAIARSVHPDKFGGERPEVHRLATRLSAEINQAYGVLKDPVKRADYMLELAGGPRGAELREVPQGLLAEMMLLRERIEEAKTAGNADALDDHRRAVTRRRRETLQRIAGLADRLDTGSEEERMEMRRLLNSVKYFDNLLRELAADPLAEGSRVQDD